MASAIVLIQSDPTLDGAFLKRMHLAFDRLLIEYRDAEDDTDAGLFDDGSGPVRLVLVGGESGSYRGQRSDEPLIVHCGPGAFEPDRTALALTVEDIDGPSRQWEALVGRLAERLVRPGLVSFARLDHGAGADDLEAWAKRHPDDPLAADALGRDLSGRLEHAVLLERGRREAAEGRQDALEQALQEALRQIEIERVNVESSREAAALAKEASEAARAAERSATERASRLEAESQSRIERIRQLETALEESQYCLSRVPSDKRSAVESARRQALAADAAAARAVALGPKAGETLHWTDTGATYFGSTENGAPEGDGVIRFPAKDGVAPRYAGEFRSGRRDGLGVGVSPQGHIWRGEWRDDEACGLGVLIHRDGRRFEGRVKPGGAKGPIATGDAHLWDADGGDAGLEALAHAAPLALTVDPGRKD